MSIYTDHPEDQLTIVMRLTTRIGYAVPASQLGTYWRPHRPDGADGSWFLAGDDPAWNELLQWFPFASQTAAGDYPTRVRVHLRHLEDAARAKAQDDWWAAVRATEWGMDPLWDYKSDGEDEPDNPANDDAYKLADESTPDVPPRYPRRELREKYGTTSLTEYAARQGLPSPYPIGA